MWSPDGKHVAFVWDRAGIQNLYVADPASPTAAPKALTSYDSGALGNAFWSKDGQRLYFSRDGDLWQVAIGGGAPQAVWTTPLPESTITPSPDRSRVAFVRPASSPVDSAQGKPRGKGSDLWIRALADGRESRVAHDDFSIARCDAGRPTANGSRFRPARSRFDTSKRPNTPARRSSTRSPNGRRRSSMSSPPPAARRLRWARLEQGMHAGSTPGGWSSSERRRTSSAGRCSPPMSPAWSSRRARTWTRSSGASPAGQAPPRSPHPTASGSRS